MGGLKGRVRRLQREAAKEGVVLRLRDGGIRVFSDQEVFAEMFLTQMDLMSGKARPSEVLDAVREATPESRAQFEQEYGTIEMVGYIVAGGYEGAWVNEHRLLLDGTVESAHHEGYSSAALRIRQEMRQAPPGSP
jgi:hypothetical protein